MRPRTLLLLCVAIAVNIALALLPMYDASNIRNWTALGSAITSSVPAMANNIWPGGFFSFMAFTPMYLSYVFSGFNLYLSVVVLKLILFFFTILTAFLLYRITQKIKPVYADAVLVFTLLNPAILYINYFWAQIDILPVFFFTIGFVLLRYVDFGGNNLKRYLVAFFPILISAFIYRYSLILIPALLVYDSVSLRQKLGGFIVAIGEAAVLFGFEYVLFRGGMYNYVGALSGSVINMSSVEGFQYWLTIPQVPYILFLVALGLVIPVLFRALKYGEPAALFFILLMFIYTSTVPLSDYFLWLYPLGILLALTSGSKLSFGKKLLVTGLPLYIGLLFISFIIGNGLQAGPFYFAYPLLRQNIVFITSAADYNFWVFIFNLFLLGSVVVSSLFCLLKSNRELSLSGGSLVKARDWHLGFSRRVKVVLACGVVVLVLVGFGFNAVYSSPVVSSNRDVFPLNLFQSVSVLDASPMDSTYYLSWDGLVVYNDWSVPVGFYHGLNLQDLNLSLSFDLNTDRYASFDLLRADNYTMGITMEPSVSLSDLSGLEPISFSYLSNVTDVPVLDDKVSVYGFSSSYDVSYRLDESSLGDYYVVAFKFKNSSLPQSVLFHFSNSKFIFDYSISNNVLSLFYYDLSAHNSTSVSASYRGMSDNGWNLFVFRPTAKGLYSWVNNESLSVKGSFFTEDTDLLVTSYYTGKASPQVGGYVTQLYSGMSPVIEVQPYFFMRDPPSETIRVPINSAMLNLSLVTTPDFSRVQVGNFSRSFDAVNSVYFGKLTWGNYGLAVTLNYLELSQKGYGYYILPVYFAVVIPFVVAFLCLPLLFKRRLLFR